MKVIQVVNYSVSKLNLGFDPLAFEHDWHIILAKEILKRTKRYEIECWQPERTLSEVYTREKDGITHRKFPSFPGQAGDCRSACVEYRRRRVSGS